MISNNHGIRFLIAKPIVPFMVVGDRKLPVVVVVLDIVRMLSSHF